jgi:hypothetical protein
MDCDYGTKLTNCKSCRELVRTHRRSMYVLYRVLYQFLYVHSQRLFHMVGYSTNTNDDGG